MIDRDFHRPETVEEALALKEEAGKGAFFLGGGTQLNYAKSEENTTCFIDLGKIVPGGITQKGNSLVIGALTTIQELIDHPSTPPSLKIGGSYIKSRQIRNQATVGGNIVTGRSESGIVPPLLCLNATLSTSSGEALPVDRGVADHTVGIITEIVIPDPGLRVEIGKVSRSSNATPVVVAAVAMEPSPAVVLGQPLGRSTRLRKVEEYIAATDSPDEEEVMQLVRESISPTSDILGSADYKRYIASVTIAELVLRYSNYGNREAGR